MTAVDQRDRDLVRLHWPVELRPAFDALFGIDDAMAEVVASATQPALAAIKLAWWREALERLDHAPPPPEPRLQAVTDHLLSRSISGADLAQIEEGWAALLEEAVDPQRVKERGKRLFSLAARLLGAEPPAPGFGELWASVDAARRGGGGWPPPTLLPRAPRPVRPLTMLTALAERDARLGPPFESEVTPARSWTILRHRLTGR